MMASVSPQEKFRGGILGIIPGYVAVASGFPALADSVNDLITV